MSFVKVTNSSFIRDTKTMALINTNTSEKQEYYARAKLIQSQKQELNMVKDEINNVKAEMSEIKQLLQQLISKQ